MDSLGETYTRGPDRSGISIQKNDPNRFLPREYIKWFPQDTGEQQKKDL
ncbi:hypothetical protein [Shouchella lonarensis]|nr:hypothetical protein [Shouchella lonarensis]